MTGVQKGPLLRGTRSPRFKHVAVLVLCHPIMAAPAIRVGPGRAGRNGCERLRRVETLNERLGQPQGSIPATSAQGCRT